MTKLKTHCKHGHELTPDNTWIGESVRYGQKGQVWRCQTRSCMTCKRNQKRLRYRTDPVFRAARVKSDRIRKRSLKTFNLPPAAEWLPSQLRPE